ncbi:ricin-type beta-trefoil lectin domain-domain-containing protein [Catenaria anguillulae PL171]|uniref:Ricin-type beta-trefoil lectin domain-domain-containing protein n=1 Tax=Catenaria anguillulae PL171 TaxID=765915 RepID=A0A1Y2HYR4_9FUNG|nr:ricin-type beta-trefoil lectin domain-domain-containing protein [Catenaria anguillulae PL171]
MFTTIHPFKLVLVLLILAVGQIAATPAPLVNSVVSLDSPSNSNTTIVSANRQGQASAEDVMDDPDYPWISDHNGCDYSHRCLDVEQSRKTWQSSDAQMWSCNRNPTAQRFTIQGYTVFRKHFRITAAAPNSDGRYCLDVPGGNAYEGQSVRWWLCNRESSAAQNWMFHNRQGYPNGWISPLSRPDLCLDPAGGESADRDGQPMILWRCSDRVIHHFKLGNWDSLACRR